MSAPALYLAILFEKYCSNKPTTTLNDAVRVLFGNFMTDNKYDELQDFLETRCYDIKQEERELNKLDPDSVLCIPDFVEFIHDVINEKNNNVAECVKLFNEIVFEGVCLSYTVAYFVNTIYTSYGMSVPEWVTASFKEPEQVVTCGVEAGPACVTNLFATCLPMVPAGQGGKKGKKRSKPLKPTKKNHRSQ